MTTTLQGKAIDKLSIFSSDYNRLNRLPISIYDFMLGSADDSARDVLKCLRGKVTLVFNVAAGCGNIPQHIVLEELNKRFSGNNEFSILAVVVDDFWCHGYPEFQNGLQAYIDDNHLNIMPAQASQMYAESHFGSTYKFTCLTNGRYDKHSYDPTWVPGRDPVQQMHPFWYFLTGAYLADVNEAGIPFQNETVGWTDVKRVSAPQGLKGYMPLTGNFEKFLISRDGNEFMRYGNGFLLGQRDRSNVLFPWLTCSTAVDGIDDFRGNVVQVSEPTVSLDGGIFETARYPFDEITRFGISHSLDLISQDIEFMLART